MAISCVRSEDEVYNLLNQCVESEETGVSKYPGMTYEQGVRDALDWMLDSSQDSPLED